MDLIPLLYTFSLLYLGSEIGRKVRRSLGTYKMCGLIEYQFAVCIGTCLEVWLQIVGTFVLSSSESRHQDIYCTVLYCLEEDT